MGRKTTFSYDTVNRLQNVSYADAQVTYTYDYLNRPTQVTDTQGGTINWSYNAIGQLLSETTMNSVVFYNYNAARQRTSMTVQGRPSVNYGYDMAGRLSSISQGAESFGYNYDILSRLESLTRPNGVITSYEYDTVNRLKRLKHFSSSQTIEDMQYGYSLDDEISSISSLQSATLVPSIKTAQTADAANRINQFGNANYSFDEKGQTTARTDSNGTTVYNWDARGRMTSANLPNGQTVSYSYDASGRRSSRTSNNQTVNFIYDGQDIVQDKQGVNVQADYINGLGIDDKLKISNASGSLYFLKDHLGSTQGLTGVSGSVTEWQKYEAFGNSSNANSLTRYGYTGRERDEQTGLNYYRARWFDSEQGRFISQDPIGFNAGMNFYTYVANHPTISNDPLGLYEPQSYDNPADMREPRYPNFPPTDFWGDLSREYDGYNPWLSLEGGGNIHLGGAGGGGALGVEYNVFTGEICLYWKTSIRFGPGLFAGAGLKLGGSFGNRIQNEGKSNGFEPAFDAAFVEGGKATLKFGGLMKQAYKNGKGGSVNLSKDASSTGGGIGAGPSIGLGLSLGVDITEKIVIKCWRKPCEN